MRFLLVILLFLSAHSIAKGQVNLDQLTPGEQYDNISAQKLNSDSNATSVLIWIRNEVKPHKHAVHTEQVYVIEGTGKMLLGDKILEVKAGDFIYIPENTIHALKVTSNAPMKVLSIQAPEFDGKDRIAVEVEW